MIYEVVSPTEDGKFVVHYVSLSLEDAVAWCERHQTAANWAVIGRKS